MEDKKKELDYFGDLAFNPNDLDTAFDDQHIIFMQYIELSADKNDEIAEERRLLKIKEAEQKEVHANAFLRYSVEKDEKGKNHNLDTIKSKVEIDKDYKKKKDEVYKQIKILNKFVHQGEILEGVVKSFQQRKNGLENKKDLWVMGYTGAPRQNSTQEEVKNSIRNKLNKGK